MWGGKRGMVTISACCASQNTGISLWQCRNASHQSSIIKYAETMNEVFLT